MAYDGLSIITHLCINSIASLARINALVQQHQTKEHYNSACVSHLKVTLVYSPYLKAALAFVARAKAMSMIDGIPEVTLVPVLE